MPKSRTFTNNCQKFIQTAKEQEKKIQNTVQGNAQQKILPKKAKMVAVQQHARTHMCPYRVALYSNILKAKKHKENKRKTHMPPSQGKK